MTPGAVDPAIVQRHLLAIDEALQILRRHQGQPVGVLAVDREKLWMVERGLQTTGLAVTKSAETIPM